MTDIQVRALTEDEWDTFRTIRLAALTESPDAFVADAATEVDYDEEFWRVRLRRARRLYAVADGEAAGVASLGQLDGAENTAEIFGLWVDPAWRGRSVAAALVRRASEEAVEDGFERIAYWVSTDNGRAVAFASSFGFRPTGRRRPMTVKGENGDDEEEIAMVLSLVGDRGASW
ncbi:MAG: GNAT family N-acetyltransferase [Dermatophilaceae bacterium]